MLLDGNTGVPRSANPASMALEAMPDVLGIFPHCYPTLITDDAEGKKAVWDGRKGAECRTTPIFRRITTRSRNELPPIHVPHATSVPKPVRGRGMFSNASR